MPACTTPELCPVWCCATAVSFSKTVTGIPDAASWRAIARPTMPAPTIPNAPPVPPSLPAITRTSWFSVTRRTAGGADDAVPGRQRRQRIGLRHETRSAYLGLHLGRRRARAPVQARRDRQAGGRRRRRPDQRHGPRLADRPDRASRARDARGV